jgi:predicted nucleotidyltransferase
MKNVVTSAIRLNKAEISVIKEAVASLDSDAKVFLFGSRTDPLKKGGDIDLLVLSKKLKPIDSLKITRKIFEVLEEQKIDIVIAADMSDPFVKIAFATGKEL